MSLFSNCGAGDVGYAGAGFRFDVIAELLDSRLSVAQLNHPKATGVPGDLRTTLPTVIEAWRERWGSERPDLLAACPPCQGMSTARGRRGSDADVEAGSRDPRNLLVEVIAEAVTSLEPRAVVVENVSAFLTRKVRHPQTGSPVSAAAYLVDQMDGHYRVFSIVADMADYGVPQFRRRSFLTFVRRDETGLAVLDDHDLAPFPFPTHVGQQISVSAALKAASLPALDASTTASAMSSDPHHSVPVWASRQYQLVAAIPPNSGASAWQTSACHKCDREGIPADRVTCPECEVILLRPIVVDGSDGPRLIKGFPTSYARMRPDRPATTVTTASGRVSSDYTLHPSEHRVLSIKECELLQTFPDGFRWGDALQQYGATEVRSMIGEAVPPLFTRQHGRILAALLGGKRPKLCLPRTNPRVARAAASLNRPTAVPG